MKEASGELSMTLVTIIAVGVIVGIFAAFWPQIRDKISEIWGGFDTNVNQYDNGGGSGDVGGDYDYGDYEYVEE